MKVNHMTTMRRVQRYVFQFGICLAFVSAPSAISFASPCVAQVDSATSQDTDSLISKWDQKYSAIQELIPRIKRSTDATERDELIALYNESISALKQLRVEIEPVLIQAAATDEPLEDKLADTLLDLGQLAVGEELYDRGYKLLQPLVDHQTEDDSVYQFAAMAAYGSDRFAEAKDLISMIEAKGGTVRIRVLQQAKADLDQRIAEWEAEKVIRETEASANLPVVKFETSEGDILIQLYEDQAPNAVANFISLIEKGFYDGLTFHRVLEQFMAQGGCPDGTGGGGPGYEIDCECYRPDYRRHFAGTLSMAHAGKNTGGSQFFLTFLATPHLNGKHTAFGRVIEGMDVLAALKRVDPNRRNPAVKPSKIVKATVVSKRDHEYKPKTHASRR